jgi:nucleotide-binding universal stress UspA family protein
VKLLVLTPEPIDANALRTAAGDGADDAEVLVISPATTQSGLRFWMNDIDEAIAGAQETADESAELLEEDGIDAVADTGEAEPAVALRDALATFAADQIVVFTHPDGDEDYREADGLDELGVPITFAEIGR